MSLALEPMALDLGLPWQEDEKQERAFKDTLKRVLIPLMLLFIVVPFLPSVDLAYLAKDDAPVRTQILLDPIVEAEPEPVPKPEPKPQPKPEPVAPVKQPSAKQPPKQSVKVDTKEAVSKSQGLAELSRQLNAARGSVDVSRMQNKNLSKSDKGKVAVSERTRLGEDFASKRSATKVSDTVMQGQVTQLSSHEAASVEGVVMNDLPGGSGQSSHLSDRQGQRDMESIRRALEHAKGNVYALYQQALRDNPRLTGEFTFKLVIEPNGSVSKLTLLVSELGISELERSILQRIKTVNFGVMDVPPTVVEYRFVFLPT